MIRPILAAICVGALCAGEPVPVSLAIADGPELTRHWEASLYGRLWRDPGLAWVRQQWVQRTAAWKTGAGLDVDALLASATGLRGAYLGATTGPDPKPRVLVQVDLGAQARPAFTALTRAATPASPAVAGADAACRLGDDGPVLALHGSRLVLGWHTDPIPQAPTPLAVDGRLAFDYDALIGGMAGILPPAQRADLERVRRQMAAWMGHGSWTVRLVPEGVHEVMDYDRSTPGLLPVDRALLDRFPAKALLVAGCGLDLDALWKAFGESYLDSLDQAMHGAQRLGAQRTQAEIDQALAGLGVSGGLRQLTGEVRGTCVLAITPGAPFPGISLAVPRSPAVDALVIAGLGKLQAVAPAEGASAVVPIPNLPVMLSVARDRGHWLLSSDGMFVQDWVAGTPGGFLASPIGVALLAQAPAKAGLMGGADSAAMVRMLTSYVAMGLSQARGLPVEGRQAILAGLNRLAAESGPTWMWAANGADGMRCEAQGPVGIGVVPIAMVAAIAIPNLLESRVVANEAATAATLKSGIFPAEIQFQAGGYQDQDGDKVGEYGTLAELSGRQPTGKVRAGGIKLVQGPLATGNRATGYHFRIYLPGGKGGAITSDDAARTAAPEAADAQEKGFVAYAWPESRDSGRYMFALGSDGQVRRLPWDGREPAWNAALGNGWDKPSTWPLWSPPYVRPSPVEAPAAPADPLF